MAAEQILIEFVVDGSQLIPHIDILQKLGQVTEEDAAKYKKIATESAKAFQAATDAAKKTLPTLNQIQTNVENISDTFINEFQKQIQSSLLKTGTSLQQFIKQLQSVEDETPLNKLQQQLAGTLIKLNDLSNALSQIKQKQALEIKLQVETDPASIASLKNQIAGLTKFSTNPATVAGLQQEFSSNLEGAQQLTAQINKLKDAEDKAGTSQTTFRQQIRQTTESLAQRLAAGELTVSELYQEAKAAGVMRDAMGDASRTISILASDTFTLDAVAQGVSTLTAGFQVYAGVSALVGSENEDLQKTLIKLNAVMSLSQGIQQITNNLQKDSAVILKGQIFLDNILAVSNKATAATYKFLGIAVEESSIAFKTLRAAIITTGVGAIIVGLGFLIEKLTATKTEVQALSKTTDDFNNIISDSSNDVKNAYLQVETLKQKIALAKQGFIDKNVVVKEYNDTLGKTTGEVKSLDAAESALAKNADAYIKFTLLKAAANIALQKAAEKAFETESSKIEKGVSDVNEAFDKAQKSSKGISFISDDQTAQDQKKLTDEKSKLIDISNDLLSQASDIAKQFGFKFSDDVVKQASAAAKKKVDEAVNTQIQLMKADPRIEAAMKEELDRQLKLQQDADQQRIADAEAAVQDRVNRTNEIENKALTQLAQQYLDNEITFEDYEKQKAQIGVDSAKKSVDEQIKAYQKLLNDPALSPEKRAETEQKVTDLKKQAVDQDVENHKKANEQIISDEQATAQKMQELFENSLQIIQTGIQALGDNFSSEVASGVLNLFDTINKATDGFTKDIKDIPAVISASFVATQAIINAAFQQSTEARKQQVDAEIAKLEDRKNAELSNTELTESQKAAITKKYAAQEAAIKNKAAKQQRQSDISQAIVNGLLAAGNALATVKPFIPAALIAAGLAVTLAAIQVANIKSAPLPQFKKGSRHAPPGYVIVGEEGPEIVKLRGGERIYTTKESRIIEKRWEKERLKESYFHPVLFETGKPKLQHDNIPQIISSPLDVIVSMIPKPIDKEIIERSYKEKQQPKIDYDLLAEKIGEKVAKHQGKIEDTPQSGLVQQADEIYQWIQKKNDRTIYLNKKSKLTKK